MSSMSFSEGGEESVSLYRQSVFFLIRYGQERSDFTGRVESEFYARGCEFEALHIGMFTRVNFNAWFTRVRLGLMLAGVRGLFKAICASFKSLPRKSIASLVLSLPRLISRALCLVAHMESRNCSSFHVHGARHFFQVSYLVHVVTGRKYTLFLNADSVRYAFPLLVASASKVFVSGVEVEQVVRRMSPEVNVLVLHNTALDLSCLLSGTNSSLNNMTRHGSSNEFRVICVGSLTRDSGAHLLLEAIKILKTSNDLVGRQVKVTLVGTGKERLRLQVQSERLGLERLVDFYGDIPDPYNRPGLIRGQHLFINLEGINLVEGDIIDPSPYMMAYMWHGTPVLCASHDQLDNLVEEGSTGFVLQPSPGMSVPQALANKISRIMRLDESIMHAVSVNARAKARFEFSLSRSTLAVADEHAGREGLRRGGRSGNVISLNTRRA